MKLSPIATIAVGRAIAGATRRRRRKAIGARAAMRMGATQADAPRRVKRTRVNWHEGH
jgi:hypothetical protein